MTTLVVNKNIKSKKKKLQTTNFIIFWDLLMFYQVFLSPQVKRWAIIAHKHDIYEFLNKLPNNLRLSILENKEISAKRLNCIEWVPSVRSLCQKQSFVNTSRKPLKQKLNFSRCALFHMKTRVSLKISWSYCRWAL